MNFAESSSGRLFTTAIGLALMGGGAAALSGEAMASTLLGAGLLFGIVCAILAVCVGLSDFPRQVLGALVGMPFALFLYSQAQGLVAQSHSYAAYVLVALGAGAIARAAFTSTAPQASEARTSDEAPAH